MLIAKYNRYQNRFYIIKKRFLLGKKNVTIDIDVHNDKITVLDEESIKKLPETTDKDRDKKYKLLYKLNNGLTYMDLYSLVLALAILPECKVKVIFDPEAIDGLVSNMMLETKKEKL